MGTGELIAIGLSVFTFLFTLYQWLVAMNSKRPRFSLYCNKPTGIRLSKDYNYFDVLFPEDCFIINLSELPNSVLSIELHAKWGTRWVQGKLIDYYRNDPGKAPQSPFPLVVMGHSHHVMGKLDNQSPYRYEFEGCPSVKELEGLTLRLEIHDQYGKVHPFTTTKRKHFPQAEVKILPDLTGQEVLAQLELPNLDREKTPQIYRVLYQKDWHINNEPHPQVTVTKYYNYSPRGKEVVEINKRESDKWESATENKFLYKEFSCHHEQCKLYMHLENNVPKSLELEIKNVEGATSQKIDLPAALIESLASRSPALV